MIYIVIMSKLDYFMIIFFIMILVIFIIIKFIEKLKNKKISKKVNEILNKKEDFIVSDAQDFHNYKYLKEIVEQKKDNFYKDTINNPPDDYKTSYQDKEKKKNYDSVVDLGWNAPITYIPCSNKSINEKYKTGSVNLSPNKVSCGFPEGINSRDFYSFYKARPALLEDYMIRGSNYMDYSDYVHPSKSNIWILSQNTKGLPPDQTEFRNIPTGWNYAFNGSPSMRIT